MLTITNINPLANQKLILTLENRDTIVLELRFLPTQRGCNWQGAITYGNVPTMRFGIVNTVNLLRQWKNVIPFGLMCYSEDEISPFQITDFTTASNGQSPRCTLYILNQTDITEFNAKFYG